MLTRAVVLVEEDIVDKTKNVGAKGEKDVNVDLELYLNPLRIMAILAGGP